MAERREFEMSTAQHARIIDASRPAAYIMIGGVPPLTQQQRANIVWAALGVEMGFDPQTVEAVPGKHGAFFTAVPVESKEEQVPYHGYIEVEVRLLRQGHGADSSGVSGSGYEVEQTETLRLEEPLARGLVAGSKPGAVDQIVACVGRVLDRDGRAEMLERWREATQNMTADKMRAALEVLEAH